MVSTQEHQALSAPLEICIRTSLFTFFLVWHLRPKREAPNLPNLLPSQPSIDVRKLATVIAYTPEGISTAKQDKPLALLLRRPHVTISERFGKGGLGLIKRLLCFFLNDRR
jgi:hypothetical protein